MTEILHMIKTKKNAKENISTTIKEFNLINIGFNPWSHFWKRNQTITYMLSKLPIFKNILYLNSEVWLGDLIKKPFHDFVAATNK